MKPTSFLFDPWDSRPSALSARRVSGLLLLLLLGYTRVSGQASLKTVHWRSFTELRDSLSIQPRPVLLYFYADWCLYCKKMDRAAWRDPEVVEALNRGYYPVRMDAESRDTIVFGQQVLVNDQHGRIRRPIHQLPLKLASRDGRPFALPALILLDSALHVEKRIFEYLSPQGMRSFLGLHPMEGNPR